LKPGQLGGPICDTTDSELKLDRIEEKIGKEKIWCDMADPVG